MEVRSSIDMDYISDEESICSQDTTCSSSGSSMELPQEWEVGFADNHGRLYYIDNEKKETFWCPPQKSWKCCFRLPPWWEVAIDDKNFLYYINHNSKITSYKHPNYENRQFEFLHQAFQARRRKVSIARHHRDGFGFVAGSEKPVIIRSVVTGSPADGQLHANDQIFSIGNQIAYNLPQPQVISMIRSCTDVLEMEVVATEDIQDVRNQGQLKSALMSRATRERRKSCPVNVRFEEKPEVRSLPPSNGLSVNIIKQMIPNVLKIYLENGQTKSFQYNAETTVKEIFTSVVERLQIKASLHFALVLIGPYPNQAIFLQPEDRVTQIVNKKVFSRWECRLELSFSPKNAYELLEKDPVAFDYWYQQTTNSIVKGHLGSEMKYDVIMRLAALQIHAAMTKENDESKFSLKDVLKEYGGLDDFLPNEIVYNFKKKDIKKSINSQLKSLERIARPGQKLTALQAKLHYLKIASESPSFGGRTFSAAIINNQAGLDSTAETLMDTSDVLVSPSHGICTLFSDTGNVLQHLVEFSQVSGIVITSHMLNKHHLKLFVKEKKALSFILSPQSADDMAFLINGYHKIFSNEPIDLPVFNLSQTIPRYKAPNDGNSKPPAYMSKHDVVPSTWNYIDEVVSTMWLGNTSSSDTDDPRSITLPIDFSSDPPRYGTPKICDRSSFIPQQQRSAVDSFIRELSIRDKQKKHIKALKSLQNDKIERKHVSQVGQFDTTRFGMDSELVEEENDSEQSPSSIQKENSVEKQSSNDGLTRVVISCSLSSDEEISDEEITELAKKVNRSGTLSRYLKMNGNRNGNNDLKYDNDDNDSGIGSSKGKIITMKIGKNRQMNNNGFNVADDDDDSGWKRNDDSDTSSNTGSLARTWSSPWGTFSEEDSTDQESTKLQADSESLLSFNDDVTYEQSRIFKEAIGEASASKEFSLRPGFNMANRNSFDKYLVKKEPDMSDRESINNENPLNDSLSPDIENRLFLLRPLSNTSDEVFFDEQCISKSDGVSVTLDRSIDKEISLKNIDRPTSADSTIDDRPKSVNLADLNIYIPGPPKMATKELDPNELRIPSPPQEFADDNNVNLGLQSDGEDSTESNAESSRSSSPDEPVEFMNNNVEPSITRTVDAKAENFRNCSVDDNVELLQQRKELNIALTNELKRENSDSDFEKSDSSSDEQVEFMESVKLDKLNINTEREESSNVDRAMEVTACSEEKDDVKKDTINSELLKYEENTTISSNKNHSFLAETERKPRDVNFRRQTEPIILPLDLPKSPFREQRVVSPLFFSATNLASNNSIEHHHKKSNSDIDIHYDHSDPFQQLISNKSPTRSPRLTLPNTPISLRRNQYKDLGSVHHVETQNQKFNSLPANFSFEEFNVFVENCKIAVRKALSLEDQLMELVSNNKQSNRLSFEGDDPERKSYLDVMRTCSKSLANRTKDIVLLATNGDLKILGKLIRSSQNEVESLVVAMLSLRDSLTLANLAKDVVVEYKEVMTCLKKCTGKSLTDPDIVKLIEKNDELTFALTILIRGLRSY